MIANRQAATEQSKNMKEGLRGKASLRGKCRFGMVVMLLLMFFERRLLGSRRGKKWAVSCCMYGQQMMCVLFGVPMDPVILARKNLKGRVTVEEVRSSQFFGQTLR